MTRRLPLGLASLALLLVALPHATQGASLRPLAPRRSISLDGTWQVAEGAMDHPPASYEHSVSVPGLLDMATPAFEEVGKRSPRRQAYWYRRTFRVDGPLPAVALLKIHKACYGTSAWLNGQAVGEHLPCFTPGYFDLRPALKGEGAENKLVIRVGADRETIPPDVPSGWDFEKYLYTPGIYDSVELLLTGAPYMSNVQVVPDLDNDCVRAIVELNNSSAADIEVKLDASIVEAATGKPAGTPDTATLPLATGHDGRTELVLPLPGARRWSPDDPFLYTLNVQAGTDAVQVRFGMRSFGFDPVTRRALLNGQPLSLRGTNVCIFRFFEDAKRGDKPWNTGWIRRLHQQFRTMHWNTIRYCIGFPPESWYDIADEQGFLIQDEFPIWLLDPESKKDAPPEFPKADRIIPQYVEWMRERWNHPCVVIWDAQNESLTPETAKAVRAVRSLDLSNRPWENGWGEPQSPADCVESHPYLFSRAWGGGKPFRLSEMPGVPGVPRLMDPQKKRQVPIIINEYCWLWLDREGSPTCLTREVYEALLGPAASADQRRTAHARNLAALTEFWRSHRECAGVLHFCGLGYSRSGDRPRPEGGATSDHWIDLEALVYEPRFLEQVRDAFNPVGVMLDFWEETATAGSTHELRVALINDLPQPWTGNVRLRVLKGSQEVSSSTKPASLDHLGRSEVSFAIALPTEPGTYTIAAELLRGDDPPVRSLRDVRIEP